LAGWVRVCGSGPPEAGPAGRTFPGYYGAGTARWWRRWGNRLGRRGAVDGQRFSSGGRESPIHEVAARQFAPLLLPLQLHRLLGHPFPRATACLQLEKRVPLAQSLSGAVSPRRNRVPPRPVFRSSSEPPDCLRCRNPKRRLRSCAGIKCAPAARRISVF